VKASSDHQPYIPALHADGDVTKIIGLLLDNTKANLSALRQLEAKYSHLITSGCVVSLAVW
jgi:hypothetical protein